MNYKVNIDIKYICTLLDISFGDLAYHLNVARSTVTRIYKEQVSPSDLFLESFYSFAYSNHIHPTRLNSLKTQFAIDKFDTLLFHGAKTPIDGIVDLNHSRDDIDFGVGFYLGESFEQASSYVFPYQKSSVYIFDCDGLLSLKHLEYKVDLDWMLTVSYFRGELEEYKDSIVLQKLIKRLDGVDVIVAPIADNNMYDVMNRFARGDISDIQAISALSASNLGKQHILKTLKACKAIKFVDRLYLCKEEKKDIEKTNKQNALVALDKVKLAISSNRRKGKYIEEILK